MRANVGKSKDLTRVAIRLPERLHEKLAKSAANNNRSLNYEVIPRLEASIDLDRVLDADTTTEVLQIMRKLRSRFRGLRLPGAEGADD